MDKPFVRARDFMYTHARLLERLLFAVRFEGAPPAAVGRLITAYQNPDGGLGHALEPDVRCPESQPLFIEIGLSAMRDAGWQDRDLAQAFDTQDFNVMIAANKYQTGFDQPKLCAMYVDK